MRVHHLTEARILVVEDETIVALDIKQRLESMGYTVVALVVSGEQAIEKARTLKPDLVLMDIKLKGKMDGIQAAEIIRDTSKLPVIFLTAFADEVTLQNARITEPFGYIVKPFEERELSISIEMALYKHQTENLLRESENRLRTIFESVTDGIFLMDSQGKILDVNPAGCAMFGCGRDEILWSNMQQLVFSEDQKQMNPEEWGLQESEHTTKEFRMRHKNGSELWVEMALAPIQAEGKPQVVGMLRDVTSRKLADLALRESEERYSMALRGVNDGLWDWNLRTGEVFYSPRWKKILGFDEEDIAPRSEAWFQLIHPEDLDRFKLDLSNHLTGLTPHFQVEYRILTKKDDYRWVLTRGLAVSDADGIPHRMAGSLADVTERKQAEQQLLHDAFHDTLTDLPNRALFLDRLQHTIERAKRYEKGNFAVLFLDLDRFKVVNDSLGHHLGDELLVSLSERLKKYLRSSDTLARLGGDEFVILLEELEDPYDAILVSERIQEDLKQPFVLAGQSVFTSASIGIVSGSIEYDRPEDILRDADIAMYRAKAGGKARYAVFDKDLRERAVTRLELEGDLRVALGRNELKVFYQPILSLATSRVMGFEALLRWFHPVRGPISPDEFIPLAEETGLILPIGRWVLQEACRQLKTWQAEFPCDPPLSVSVNISSRQFAQADLLDQIKQILDETGLDPHTLKLELTESLLMENSLAARTMLNRLREMGMQLLIDDFGTGFSSLGYVQNFPIDTIKIDRIFINQMSAHGSRSEIAHTIIQLAHELGLGTIAEGIETQEQLERLKELECTYGQGWLFSKAISHENAEVLLKNSMSG